jgi:mannose-6-phosphate isomerase-like protein (cupin superfamily)
MNASTHTPDPGKEYLSSEGCRILETWNTDSDPAVSVARARVAAGITTQLHRLHGVTERYVILSGSGVARVGTRAPARVNAGDIVSIPAEVSQQITNDGTIDLVFYCICTPRFIPACYEAM